MQRHLRWWVTHVHHVFLADGDSPRSLWYRTSDATDYSSMVDKQGSLLWNMTLMGVTFGHRLLASSSPRPLMCALRPPNVLPGPCGFGTSRGCNDLCRRYSPEQQRTHAALRTGTSSVTSTDDSGNDDDDGELAIKTLRT